MIKPEEQYKSYCNRLEYLVQDGLTDRKEWEECALLYLFISDRDEKHRLGPHPHPATLNRTNIGDHDITQIERAEIAGAGKSYSSEILYFKKKMSKKSFAILPNTSKFRQEALNLSYELKRSETTT